MAMPCLVPNSLPFFGIMKWQWVELDFDKKIAKMGQLQDKWLWGGLALTWYIILSLKDGQS